MVAGKLEARGRGYGNIKFTLQENLSTDFNESVETVSISPHLKFVAGRTLTEGRLLVCNIVQ